MSHAPRPLRPLLLVALLTALLSPAAFALILGGLGNDPVNDAGWPLGAVDVANLKTRVGWWEGPPFGGGQYQFLYRGTTDDFNAALAAFAKIRAPLIELIVLDGPHEAFYLKIDRGPGEKDKPKIDPRVDWTFDVWVPANWHRLYNNPKSTYASDQPNFRKPVDPPRMHVYIGGGGMVEWDKVKVPDGVKVIDQRASAAGVKPAGGAVLRGGVYDMATGKPVSRARVVLEANRGRDGRDTAASGEADALGAFEVGRIPAGTFRVSVSADGYAPRAVGYHAFTENGFRELNVELVAEAKLAGTVTDDGGSPVKGAKVRPTPMAIDGRGYTSPNAAEVVTDESGRFVLTGLPKGYAGLWCSAEGYFQPNSVGTLYEVPADDVALQLVRTGRLRVTVVAPDNKPVADNQLHVHVNPPGDRIGKWGGSAQLKPDGSYEFNSVPPGTYWASTQFHPGPAEQNPAAKSVAVESGKTAEVKLVHRSGRSKPGAVE